VTKLKMNITTKEDLKSENGRLKRELEILESGIEYANEQLNNSVTKESHKRAISDLKIELEEAESTMVHWMKESDKYEQAYHKEHSLVIQLDAELENSRDQYKKVISHNVNLTKENEHLRGLVKIWI
jgi:hypothetical protein